MVDSKPLLQDRPPAYNAVPGAYEYGPQQQGYGAIPPAVPPPYPYPDGQGKYLRLSRTHLLESKAPRLEESARASTSVCDCEMSQVAAFSLGVGLRHPVKTLRS